VFTSCLPQPNPTEDSRFAPGTREKWESQLKESVHQDWISIQNGQLQYKKNNTERVNCWFYFEFTEIDFETTLGVSKIALK